MRENLFERKKKLVIIQGSGVEDCIIAKKYAYIIYHLPLPVKISIILLPNINNRNNQPGLDTRAHPEPPTPSAKIIHRGEKDSELNVSWPRKPDDEKIRIVPEN